MTENAEAKLGLVGGIFLLSAIALACTILVPSGWAIWLLVAPLDLLLVSGLIGLRAG